MWVSEERRLLLAYRVLAGRVRVLSIG